MRFKVNYIQPCISEKGKIMAEAQLECGQKGRFFDKEKMCKVLQNSLFKDVKCSKNLGVAKVEYKNKTIILNHKGKIDVRKAWDKEDALATIKLMAKVLEKVNKG